jgi:hypothetical protein
MPPGVKTPSLLRSNVVTIPGRGDLAPPRHQLPIARVLIGLLVFVLLAGGGYAAFLGLSGGGSSKPPVAQLPLCPVAPTISPTQRPGPLRLIVNNATQRSGLAAEVAATLQTRGFHVLQVGNSTLTVKGPAIVRYSADRRLVADKVAAQITGSTLATVAGHGKVVLVLGPKFHSLASTKHAKAAYLLLLTPTATPTPSGGCRPQD